MEIQTLLNFLTTNGFGVPTTFILIFLSILKLRPITFFTATGFERKFFSKEADAIYILYYYFLSCIFITFLLLGFTIISIGIPFNINLGLILFYLSGAIFFCLTETTYTRPFIEKRINQKIKKQIEKYAETLVSIYLLFLIFSVVYFFGKTLLLSLKSELTVTFSNIQLFLDNFIAFTILYLMLSVLLSLMFTKLFQTKPFRQKQKHFYITDDNNSMWYLLRPLNKEQYLIGDQFDIKSCTKIKLVNKAELFDCSNKEIHIQEYS